LKVNRAGRRPALSYGILQNQNLKQPVSPITEAFRGGEPLNREPMKHAEYKKKVIDQQVKLLQDRGIWEKTTDS
jgi:hypothetical protein